MRGCEPASLMGLTLCCYCFLWHFVGETDWKILAIDVNDENAAKINGTLQMGSFHLPNNILNLIVIQWAPDYPNSCVPLQSQHRLDK